jgi:hypothetical protein
MTSPNTLGSGQNPPASSGTSPLQAAPTGTPGNGATPPQTAPTAPAEFRFPDSPEIPVWARGKTHLEALGQGDAAIRGLQSFVQTGQPPQQFQQQTTQPQYQQPPAQQPRPFANEEYVSPAELQAYAPQAIQQYIAPQLQQTQAALASMALEQVRRDNAQIFQKYAGEVNELLAKVPVEQRTVDNLRLITDIVRGRHVEELASERASRLVAEMGTTVRSNGGQGAGGFQASDTNSSSVLQNEKVPASWRAMAERVGLNERTIDDYLQANGMTREQFVEQFNRGGIVTEMSSTDKQSPLARARQGE